MTRNQHNPHLDINFATGRMWGFDVALSTPTVPIGTPIDPTISPSLAAHWSVVTPNIRNEYTVAIAIATARKTIGVVTDSEPSDHEWAETEEQATFRGICYGVNQGFRRRS
jgi:hypothetical protein